MEKLSLNDILALLLPGLFAMFCIHIFIDALPVCLNLNLTLKEGLFETNEFLNTTYLLLIAIIAGASVYFFSNLMFNSKLYKRNKGLYKRTSTIFNETPLLNRWSDFFNNDCKTILGHYYDGSDFVEQDKIIKEKEIADMQGHYFDYIFYAIMNSEHGEDARTQQNYYFLFRHLFVVCLLLLIASFGFSIYFTITLGFKSVYHLLILAILSLLFAYVFFRPLGMWYRSRMVKTLFSKYYIEKTDKDLKS